MPDQVRHDIRINHLIYYRDTVSKAGIQEELMNKQPAVYILASKRNGTLYIGVTSNLNFQFRM
jgi:hypothetical protein